VCAPHDPQEGKELSHPDQNRDYARRDQESVLCVLSVNDTRTFQQNVTDSYRRRRASRNANRDHNDIRQCPHRYNAGKSVDAMEEALAARGLPCKHIVTHHDETLRREEQKYCS
jgi:hypothetical protein